MAALSRSAVQHLCTLYGVRPTKSSGQHFLISPAVLRDIVAAADLSSDDMVLEIGPGFGALTTELLNRVASVIAVELDPALVLALQALQRQYRHLQVVPGDVIDRLPEVYAKVADLQYSLVANLPYNITSRVLRIFLETAPRPKAITILIQKEVAQRLTAEPGGMSLLSLSAQLYGHPRIVRTVSADNFWPAPEVESAVVRIDSIGQDVQGYLRKLDPVPVQELFRIARMGFAGRRKQLHNTLAAGLRISPIEAKKILLQADIQPSIRPQELSIDQWIRLTQSVVQ